MIFKLMEVLHEETSYPPITYLELKFYSNTKYKSYVDYLRQRLKETNLDVDKPFVLKVPSNEWKVNSTKAFCAVTLEDSKVFSLIHKTELENEI